jgi:nitroimidazol reductase NimA-like FMN-containing flavoprotein (pyridoxamine 5'-phosphate oxidase superfamily)
VRETEEDLSNLQALLDKSAAAAGPHMREVITFDRRLDARELCRRLTGMRLLTLATSTMDGRPLTGPVDGVFYRGAFYFGSSPDAVRMAHIKRRPHVSATHLPDEAFSVTVHGRATLLDMRASENAELREVLLDIYTPTYGANWELFLDANIRARIDADRMFTFHID